MIQPDGTINYPPNTGGIPGTEKTITIGKSNVPEVGRYGVPGPKSDYVTKPGADPGKLSLPPTTNPSVYIKYEVVKPILGVEEATIMPWAGDSGLEVQYKLPKPIQWYIDNGYLIEK